MKSLYINIAISMGLTKNVVEYVVNAKRRNASHEEIIHSVKDLLYEEISENEIVEIWERSKELL
mgnify:FL=1